MALEKPLVVVSDVHLLRGGTVELADSLIRLVRAHPGHEIVLNGDIFTLSLDPPDRPSHECLRALLDENRPLCEAFRRHVIDGGRLDFVAGNHDGALVAPASKIVVDHALDLQHAAPVSVSPWFVRRDTVHIEHGHVFDPDNAPTHPLAPCSPTSEPLGIALTRRFIAPSGAMTFVHAHETTPLGGLASAIVTFGPRAPSIIARYFRTAIGLCLRAGTGSEIELERRTGEALIAQFAQSNDVPAGALEAILAARRRPTHHDAADLFMRLYFDRVMATLTAAGGALAVAAGSAVPGGVAIGVALAYLGVSVSRGKNRYAGRVENELRRASEIIRQESGASLVVFGHTHREEAIDGYLNTGSFGYPRDTGRPYVFVDIDGSAELRRLTS